MEGKGKFGSFIGKLFGVEPRVTGGTGELSLAIELPLFDGAGFGDIGIVGSAAANIVDGEGGFINSLPGAAAGLVGGVSQGGIDDLGGSADSSTVSIQGNLGKKGSQALVGGIKNQVVQDAANGALGLIASGGATFDNNSNLTGVEGSLSKGLNIGVSVETDVATFSCSIKTGCNGDTRGD